MRLLCAVTAALLTAFLTPALLAQNPYSTGFEDPPFVLGDVNGQNGWGHLSNSPTGGTIVAAPAGAPGGFGAQSLQIQTRNVDFFGVSNHLYSALINPAAGETGSTAEGVAVPNPNNTFEASFWYHTPVAPVISTRGDGRFAELDPSSKGPNATDPANRYAQVRVINNTNTAAGLVRIEIGWYTSGASTFSVLVAADNLAWDTWYRFDYLIHFVDGLDGTAPNDRFRLSIYNSAGTLVGSACGSTWESAWKTGSFGGGTTPRAVNGFDFWTQTGPNGTVVGFIDNFTMSSSDQVLDAPGVTVTGTSNVCAGGSTLLTANATGGTGGITSYTWRDAANAIVGTSSTLVAGAGTYTVAVTDAFCSTATSTPFAVSEFAPLAVSISGNTSVCFGATTTLTANVSGGSGTITGYEWRDASNALVGTGSSVVVGAGTYTVRATDASCGFATSAPVTVQTTCPATPIITVSGGPFTYDATPHSATATATDGSGNPVSGTFTFTYDGSPVPPTNAGTYAVVAQFTSSDQNYSDATGNGTLVINRAPTTTTITSVSPSPSTVGEPVRVQFTLGGIFGTPSGTVTVTDGIDSCTAAATATECNITFSTPGSRTITATYSGDANHFGSTSAGRLHQVEPADTRATASVEGIFTICEGGSAAIRVRLTGFGPWQITWSDGLVETVTTSTHTRTVSPAETSYYSITAVVDQDGPGDTFGTAVVAINRVPAPSIEASGVPRLGQPLTLTASTGYSSYQWFRNGAAIAGATSRVFSILSVTASDFGTYTVSGTRDACSSAASAGYSLRPLSLPSDNAVIPVVGNTRGVGGALFRTTVHLVNASDQRITGQITFIDDRVPAYPYEIEAGDTLFIDDLLPETYSGLTSANVIRLTGPLPTAVVHVFNDGGVLGTEGLIERIVPAEEALVAGDRAVLVTPIDPVTARFTVGMRSLSSGLSFRVIRRSFTGELLGTVTRTMSANSLTHEPVSMLIGENSGFSESLTFEILEGSGVIYGTATDNGTNDPNMQIASRVVNSGVAERLVLPVAGRTRGAFDSDFATDVQIHNPSPVAISGTLIFRPVNLEVPINIAPFATVALPDVFVTHFRAIGIGALDFVVTAAVRPVAVARVFNFADEGQTSVSMTFVPQEDVLVAGEQGVLAAPHLPEAARFNIGVRALTALRIEATIRNSDGDILRVVPLGFPAESFQQSAASDLLGYTFTGDESVVFDIIEGSAVIYGVWTDNVTQDPALQYAARP
jgi:hypothetical protein